MSRVLVVDDECRYRDELETALRRGGHEVRLAASGRDAIDIGIRYRPDVLITDWMLQNSIHGLRVAEVLRIVRPSIQTILITGYASCDLRGEAEKVEVFEFVEKPFHLEHIHKIVRQAAASARAEAPGLPVGIMEADSRGAIQYANRPARDLFSQTAAGRDAATLQDLFGAKQSVDLAAASTRWVDVFPLTPTPKEWHVRAKDWEDTGDRLFVVLPAQAKHHKHHPIVTMLLGVSESGATHWPLKCRALIVDDAPLVRQAVVSSLESLGCLCHAAETAEVALRLFERDPDVKVVLLDYDLHATDAPELVRKFRAIRPDVSIVGTCTTDRRCAFAEMGVQHFLEKPYAISDLINLLTDRIGNCAECGLPIPLRRPKPGEPARSWVCCGCGASYHAVFDPDFPHDVLRHVRPADSAG
jgi:CheY-like chemotaxis protein